MSSFHPHADVGRGSSECSFRSTQGEKFCFLYRDISYMCMSTDVVYFGIPLDGITSKLYMYRKLMQFTAIEKIAARNPTLLNDFKVELST